MQLQSGQQAQRDLHEKRFTMATTSSREAQIQKRVEELLASLSEPVNYEETIAELRREVKSFEERYGLPSDKIHDAIEAGELVEDLEVGNWIFRVRLLNSLEKE